MHRFAPLFIAIFLLTGCASESTQGGGGDALASGSVESDTGEGTPAGEGEAAPTGGDAGTGSEGGDAHTAMGDSATEDAGGPGGSTDLGPEAPSEDVADIGAPEATPAPDPAEPGSFAFEVSTHTETLSIPGGAEDVLIVIYMPEGEGPFPLITFTHGFQLAPADYVSYGEHLASWGYIALLPQLPGGLLGGPTHVDLKHYLGALLDWAEEDESVLQSKVDLDRIALAGHSMGGKISLLLATEDPRPLAVFGVDPVDAAGGPMPVDNADFPSVTPQLMGDIVVPLVLLGETTNGSSDGALLGQSCAPSEDNFQAYFEHAESPALEIDVLGASHMSFLDDPDCGLACFVCPKGSDDPATSRMLAQRYMVAFFNMVLRGDEGYRAYLTGEQMAADVDAGLVATQTKNAF